MASNILIALAKSCNCPGRRLPVRLDGFVVALIAGSTLQDTALAITYRCLKCGVIVEITVADVRSSIKGAA